MKQLLVFTLLISGLIAKGQVISDQTMFPDPMGHLYIDTGYSSPKFDTVKCLLLVCDTNLRLNGEIVPEGTNWGSKNPTAFYIKGYIIIKHSHFAWENELNGYLDADKKPLKYFVWLSKEIKP